MRRGCISLGDIQCTGCHHTIDHSKRYLAVEEERGKEVAKGKTSYYCIDCATKKGYAYHKEEKDGTILSFFQV
jgi:hypothetical protein